jgi:hypothetical protein
VVDDFSFEQFQTEKLVNDMDQARDEGLITIEKYVKSGDGKKQVERLSANEIKLHDYDTGTQSGGIRVSNTSDGRYFTFKIKTQNTGYFEDAGFAGTITDSGSIITFVLGPNMKFEIDIDHGTKVGGGFSNLAACYLEAAYLTGSRYSNGSLQVAGWSKDFNGPMNDEATVTYLGEVRVEQLPDFESVFVTGNEGTLLGIYNNISTNLQRFTGYDEGRDIARTNPYNTVKIRKNPLVPGTPTLVREIVPGFPVEYGVTFSEGSTGAGPTTSLLPGDSPGSVYSISQNIPSFLYPFTKEDGGRYTVMDLAESDAPEILSFGPVEAIAGNEIEKIGDLPYFRFWGDAVLMTPIVISAVAVGVGLFFLGPPIASAAATSVIPLAKTAVQIPISIGKGLVNGTANIGGALKRIPANIKEAYYD